VIGIASLPDGSALDSPLASDIIITRVQNASLIYCKAIHRRTHSQRCALCRLAISGQYVASQLSRWKKIPGIFLFVISSGFRAERTPHGDFTKAMFRRLRIFGMDHFELVDAALMVLVKLQSG